MTIPRFPFPPRPLTPPGMKSLTREEEVDDEEDEEDEKAPKGMTPQESKDRAEASAEKLRKELLSKGYDPELVEMGVKVAKNHMRPEEEALEIGRNYVKETSK